MDYTDDTDCVLCLKLTAETRRRCGVFFEVAKVGCVIV
jgi:hypothetical protein